MPVGNVKDVVSEEMERLRQLPPVSQDYQVLFGYLKLVASLPWSTTTEDRNDLQKSKLVLSMKNERINPVCSGRFWTESMKEWGMLKSEYWNF